MCFKVKRFSVEDVLGLLIFTALFWLYHNCIKAVMSYKPNMFVTTLQFVFAFYALYCCQISFVTPVVHSCIVPEITALEHTTQRMSHLLRRLCWPHLFNP